jgi:hypothetical protein
MRKRVFLFCVIFLLNGKLFAQNWVPHIFPDFENKVGYIDSVTGETVVFWHFDSASPFQYGLATACYKGKWGCFNANGEIIVPFVFRYLRLINDSVAGVDYNKHIPNERYCFKGRHAYTIISGDINNPTPLYDYINISQSILENVMIIDSDLKRKALKDYQDEIVLKVLRQHVDLSSVKQNRLWNTFQVNFISFPVLGKIDHTSFIELRTGIHFQNKFILSGLSIS